MRRALLSLLVGWLMVMPAIAQSSITLSVAEAEAGTDPLTGMPIVTVTLDAQSSQDLADFSTEHLGKVLDVLINDRVVMAPTISSPLLTGSFVIAGSFSQSEVDALAEVIGTASAPLLLRVQSTGKVK